MKNKKKFEIVEKELEEQKLNYGLDNDTNKAPLEKSMRQIADTVKKEGLTT